MPDSTPRQLPLYAEGFVSGTNPEVLAFRYTEYDVPFWVRPNSRPNRWNPAGEAPTQYLSLTPEGAWAELVRHEGFEEESQLDDLAMPIWAARVPSAGMANLFDPQVRDAFGLTEGDLLASDWEKCQAAAPAIRRQYRALIAPAYALPGATSVVVFGPRRRISLDKEPKLASAIPADVVAIGRPPRGLVQRVAPKFKSDTLF